MKPEELEERLQDAERVLALHGKRLEKLEVHEIPTQPAAAPTPDYSSQFEELKALVQRHDPSTQALQIYAQITSFRKTITKLPKVLPVRHHHHLEDKSRGFVIGGIVCLLVTAICAGLSMSLYRKNSTLQESNIKYRMIRQAYPHAGMWVDSIYYNAQRKDEWMYRLQKEEASPLLQQ